MQWAYLSFQLPSATKRTSQPTVWKIIIRAEIRFIHVCMHVCGYNNVSQDLCSNFYVMQKQIEVYNILA